MNWRRNASNWPWLCHGLVAFLATCSVTVTAGARDKTPANAVVAPPASATAPPMTNLRLGLDALIWLPPRLLNSSVQVQRALAPVTNLGGFALTWPPPARPG